MGRVALTQNLNIKACVMDSETELTIEEAPIMFVHKVTLILERPSLLNFAMGTIRRRKYRRLVDPLF